MRTASERHQKGLMSPYIYQILIAGEIKLPVLLEDENHREFPSIHVIYRPIRQMVYAILFNLHHRMYLATKSKEKGGKYGGFTNYGDSFVVWTFCIKFCKFKQIVNKSRYRM